MKKKWLPIAAIALSIVFALSACGGRLPKTSRSENLIKHFFKKYAKKYPDTVYGKNNVTKVEVNKQEEIRKNFASIEAYLTLGDGNLRRIFATVKKTQLGWRFVSWEDATN